MEYTEHELRKLRYRFCEDVGAPIQVLQEPYFSDRLSLFDKDYGTVGKWDEYYEYVTESFRTITDYLEWYHTLRKNIIKVVSETDAFKRFNESEEITSKIKEFRPVIGDVNLYTQEQVKDGSNCFISIDMRKANFQTLRHIDPEIVFGCDTYEDFIDEFTDVPLVKKSKKTRTIIFGQLNPNRTMKCERMIMGMIESSVTPLIGSWFELFSMNSDELIYKLRPGNNFDEVIGLVSSIVNEDFLYNEFNLDLRVKFFSLRCHNFKTAASDKIMNVFVKEYNDGSKDYKCANEIYFPQTYKLINGLGIKDSDLVFYYDKSELAKFFSPLVMV